MLTFFKKPYLSFIFYFAVSCQVYKNPSENISNGEYFGYKGLYEAYLKIDKDNIVVDIIYREKYPTYHFSDTIKVASGNNKWQGKFFLVLQK